MAITDTAEGERQVTCTTTDAPYAATPVPQRRAARLTAWAS